MTNANIFLKNGFLIDGTGKKEAANVSIAIINGRIASIFYDDTSCERLENSQVIDLNGLAILPGFINAHVHSGFKYLQGEPYRDFSGRLLKSLYQWRCNIWN